LTTRHNHNGIFDENRTLASDSRDDFRGRGASLFLTLAPKALVTPLLYGNSGIFKK